MPKYLLTLLIAILCASGHAVSLNANEYFRKQATRLPLEIINKCGIRAIGNLQVESLIQGINSVEWRFIPTGERVLYGSGVTRAGFVHLPQEGFISVNEEVANELISSQSRRANLPVLAIHESFRALGIQDDNYENSLAILETAATCHQPSLEGLSQMTLSPSSPKGPVLAPKKEGTLVIEGVSIPRDQSRVQDRTKASGGVTSTGGGGNDLTISVKTLLIFLTFPSFDQKWEELSVLPEFHGITRKEFIQLVSKARVETQVLGRTTDKVQIVFLNAEKIYWVPEEPLKIQDRQQIAEILITLAKMILVNR